MNTDRGKLSKSFASALLVLGMSSSSLCLSACSSPRAGESSPLVQSRPYEHPQKAMGIVNVSTMVPTTSSNGAAIDSSHVHDGYVVVSCSGSEESYEKKVKAIVTETSSGRVQQYVLPSSGNPVVLPLPLGSAEYSVSIYRQVSGERYCELASEKLHADMQGEGVPFSSSNVYCSYDEDDRELVELSLGIVEGCETEREAVSALYGWVTENIAYDAGKAGRLSGTSGYVPSPSKALSDRQGICFDYSSLFAAMCRICGISCRVVTGHVEPSGLYHAWNEVLMDGEWERLDPTFDANGSEGKVDTKSLRYCGERLY